MSLCLHRFHWIRTGFIIFIPSPGLVLGYTGPEILIVLFFLIILISYPLLKHMFKFGLIKTLNQIMHQRDACPWD